jgi:succinate dehydrogenase / fumarate reductase cytochrome b subunit
MAVTGLILFGFIVAHLLGNLQVFLGPERLNSYSAFLKSLGELLWVARIILIVSFVTHTILSIQVSMANRAARPKGYREARTLETNFAARSMMFGGPMILFYLIYHLLMFTFLTTGPGYSHTDVYSNVVSAFRVPMISGVYILAMIFLGLHLYHGTWSMLQTLGLASPASERFRRVAAPVVAVGVAGGYIAIPVAILAGWVG